MFLISVLNIVLIVIAVIAVILVILYFVGSKLQEKQAATEKTMEQMSMVVSLLVLDKQNLHIIGASCPTSPPPSAFGIE